MRKKLEIDINNLKKIFESEYDDNILKLKVGEYIIGLSEKRFPELSRILNTKFIVTPKGIDVDVVASRCCRGRE